MRSVQPYGRRWPCCSWSPGCKKETPQVVYRAVPVEQRDIVVSAQAAGAIQPDTTVEVKSKASGEVLQLNAETGQLVKRGAPLVRIDPRNARNTLAQAQADLDVAQAKLANATSQKRRADELFKSQSITEQEHDQSVLDYADASAQVVRSRVAVDNARIQLEDTDVRAPITGTIIAKTVERGTVIASATANVSGGTTLLQMADLNLVQVRTLVDETDIGKVQPGQLATITVDAYPNRPFEGTVLKIEPQAQTEQNVTVFPVLVRIQNREGLLRPGHEHRGRDPRRQPGRRARGAQCRAPDAARRRLGGAGAGAGAGGGAEATGRQRVPEREQRRRLAADGRGQRRARDSGQVRPDSRGGWDLIRRAACGRIPPPAGGASSAGQPGAGRRTRGTDAGGGRYIVFAKRNGVPTPVWIRTGLTDLDYSEVLGGLSLGDSVYVLPSASLVQSQQDMQRRMNQITGGGGVPGMRQQTSGGAGGTGGTPAPTGR